MRKVSSSFGPCVGALGVLALAFSGGACSGGGAGNNHVVVTEGSAGTNGAGTAGTGIGSGTAGTTSPAGTAGSTSSGTSGSTGSTAGNSGASGGGSPGTGGSGDPMGTAGTAGGAMAGSSGTGGAGGGTAGGSGTAGSGDMGYTGPFTCTLVSGLLVTQEWFQANFENDGVDGTQWEGKFQHYGYIDIWAQDPPAGFAWTAPIQSACTKNSTNPDRVLFTAWSWELAYMEDKYIADTVQDIMQFKKNFPGIKRFELATIVRCPGNKMCNPNAAVPPIAGVTDHNAGQQDCYVAPQQDDALAKVAAMFPGFVYVAPKWESPTCENPVNGAHLYHENPAIAKMIATWFMSNP
jgi:hypothetical protein